MSAKKHIIFSTYDDLENPYYAGGGARAVHEVARRLVSDFKVTVLTGTFPGAAEEFTRDGVTYMRVGSAGLGPKLGQMAFSAVLPYYAKQLKYDVWIESFTPPFSTSTLPLVSDKPVIGLVHMLSGEDMERKYKLPFGLIENAGLKWYRSLIVLNPALKKKIMRSNPNAQIAVIPNGVTKPHTTSANGTEHFLFMGRIEINQKGIDLLLKSFSAIRDKVNHQLVIAGGGNKQELKSLRKQILDLNLATSVRVVGRVTGAQKDDLFRKSLAVICPSRFETFPLIALETMSYKKCLVGFDIEGLGWIPDDCRAKVSSFNVEELSATLLELSNHPKIAKAIGARSYELVKDYDWDTSAEKYKEFILEILDQARAAQPALLGARS